VSAVHFKLEGGTAPAWCACYYELAIEVERVAKKKHLTMSRALVELAQRGVEAEGAARADLNATYRRFMSESDPERKGEAGKDLIRAIFGNDATAEDSIL
jgi:hypothetical protein